MSCHVTYVRIVQASASLIVPGSSAIVFALLGHACACGFIRARVLRLGAG